MHQPSGSRGIAAAFAIAFLLAACGSESQSPAESSQATTVEPSPAQPSASPSADEGIGPAPADLAGDPDEILLRMDITPDIVSPNPQGLGGAGWFAPGADFTLYGDGTIIFRDFAEDQSNPQNDGSHQIGHPLQTGRLAPDQVAEVLRFALDEGGLADAQRWYAINVVDLYTLPAFEIRTGEITRQVTLHGGFMGFDSTDGTDLERLGALSEYLSHIDEHLGIAVEPWTPDSYWGFLHEVSPHEASDPDPIPWPWVDIQPEGWLEGLRSILPEDVAALGLADVSGGFCCVQLSGPDGAGPYSLYIAPAIPTPVRSDAMAEVVTNDLVMRSQPGTGQESEIYSPSVSAPMLLYVSEGPVEADGYDWYLVAPVTAYNDVNATAPSGWLAAAGGDGEPWIAATSQVPLLGSCPFPSLDVTMSLEPLARLACFGNETLTLEGTFGGCGYGDVISSSAHWLVNAGCSLFLPDTDLYALGNRSLVIHMPPGSEPDAQPGAQIRVEGHFDDPGAEACVDEPTPPGLEDLPQIVVLRCRGEFVATQVTIISD